LRHGTAKDALAAAEIEHAITALHIEQFERSGDNNGLVKFGAALADDAVIPVGRFFP
jgi:hypothetical protein